MPVRAYLRGVFCWKVVFYELLLPALRLLGPSRYDAHLGGLGRAVAVTWPGRRAKLNGALRRAQQALDLDGPIDPLWSGLAANTARFLARDYALDIPDDAATLARF